MAVVMTVRVVVAVPIMRPVSSIFVVTLMIAVPIVATVPAVAFLAVFAVHAAHKDAGFLFR